MIRSSRIYRIEFWMLVLILGTVAWRALRYALVFPMWGDEGMLAVNFHDRGFLDLLQPLDYWQVAPPGFLWLELVASRWIGFTEPALRLIPFLAGLAAVLVFWKACRKLLDSRSALMAVAVFAASFYPARYAGEVKPYSMDLLVALAILLAAWSVYERPGSIRRWLVFTVISVLSVWLSYPSVFIAGGACLWLLAVARGERSSRDRVRVFLSGMAIVASFVAMFLLAGAGQRSGAPAGYWEAGFPPISQPWMLPVWLIDVHTGMMLAYPNGGHSGGSAVSFLLAVVGAVVMWRSKRPALVLLLSPLPLMFLAAALKMYPYGASARVAQHIAPAACMLIGTGIVCVMRRLLGARRTIRSLPIAVLPFLAVVVGGIVRDIVRPYHSEADVLARGAIRLAAMESEPGDGWLVYASRDRGGNAPHFSRFVGMGGRTHFQILRHAPGPVFWAPDPAILDPSAHGRVRLIAYGNRVFEPDRVHLGAYVDAVASAVGGTPIVTRHELPDREWIEIVAFAPE